MDENSLAAWIILLTSLTSLCLYLCVTAALYKIWTSSKNDFYLLLIGLALVDCCALALYFFYSAPCTFLQRPMFGRKFEVWILGPICTSCYFSGLALLLNIGTNRYFSICRKLAYKMVYNRCKILISIMICYLYGMVSCIPQMTGSCVSRYFEDSYTWSFDACDFAFLWYDRSSTATIFLSLIVLYTIMFVRLRKRSKVANSTSNCASLPSAIDKKREKVNQRLAMQSFLVVATNFTAGMAFTIVPMLTQSKWLFLMLTIIDIAAKATHPLVYVIFNVQIRKTVRDYFRKQKNETNIIVNIEHPRNYIGGMRTNENIFFIETKMITVVH